MVLSTNPEPAIVYLSRDYYARAEFMFSTLMNLTVPFPHLKFTVDFLPESRIDCHVVVRRYEYSVLACWV